MRTYPRDILFTVVDCVTRFDVPIILSTRAYTLSFLVHHNATNEFQSLFYQLQPAPRECVSVYKTGTPLLTGDLPHKQLC